VTGFGSFDNSQNVFFKSAKWLTRETDRLSDNILRQTVMKLQKVVQKKL